MCSRICHAAQVRGKLTVRLVDARNFHWIIVAQDIPPSGVQQRNSGREFPRKLNQFADIVYKF